MFFIRFVLHHFSFIRPMHVKAFVYEKHTILPYLFFTNKFFYERQSLFLIRFVRVWPFTGNFAVVGIHLPSPRKNAPRCALSFPFFRIILLLIQDHLIQDMFHFCNTFTFITHSKYSCTYVPFVELF